MKEFPQKGWSRASQEQKLCVLFYVVAPHIVVHFNYVKLIAEYLL